MCVSLYIFDCQLLFKIDGGNLIYTRILTHKRVIAMFQQYILMNACVAVEVPLVRRWLRAGIGKQICIKYMREPPEIYMEI